MKKNTVISIVFGLLTAGRAFAQFVDTMEFVVVSNESFDNAVISNYTITGTGINTWTINNVFSGGGIYPDVPGQTNTIGGIGQISAGNNNYLHIVNNASSVKNANYNPAVASDQTVEYGGYCTHGYERIVLQFWWLCNGSPSDYGEVYYSADGGPMTLCTSTEGRNKYGSMPQWKFETIEYADFIDNTNLRFYFRWVNDGINTNDVLPFSIDDIQIVGYYDPDDVEGIRVTDFPDSLCQEDLDPFLVQFQVLENQCPGDYLVEISDANGDFTNSTWLGIIPNWSPTVGNWQTDLSAAGIRIPTDIPFGNCYKMRISRLSPPSSIGTVVANICLKVIDCCDYIETQDFCAVQDPYYSAADSCNPPGLPADQQPVCIYSMIIVKFMSYGAYNPGNSYVLELSDSSGSFANPTVIGGPTPDTRTWDPALGYMPPPPGTVSGQIPVVPPGCNYYVRITSTNPLVNDTLPGCNGSIPWGPFCIKECDIKTNDAENINLCITYTEGDCDTIKIITNSFDSTFSYGSGNEFIAQLLAMPDMVHQTCMGVVNEGGLGVWQDTISGDFLLCAPPLPDYLAMIGDLGSHYFRIISTNPSDSCNDEGSLVILNVSGITGIQPQLEIVPQYIRCGDNWNNTVTFNLVSPNPVLPGTAFLLEITGFYPILWDPIVDGNPIPLTFPAVSGTYYVTVQEQGAGGGCMGPKSVTYSIIIDLLPDVRVNGPRSLCAGDTVTYSANFEDATFYEWGVNWMYDGMGEVLYYGNNEITIVAHSIGSFSVELQAQNECDVNTASISVNVVSSSIASAWPDTTICTGDTVMVYGRDDFLPVNNTFYWYQVDQYGNYSFIKDQYIELGNDSLMVYPSSTSVYAVKIDTLCSDTAWVVVNVIPEPVLSVLPANLCLGDSVQLGTNMDSAVSYLWKPDVWINDNTVPNPVVYPPVNTEYSVTITYDTLCRELTNSVIVEVNTPPTASTGDDVQIFQGFGTTITAAGGTQYIWTPPYGLDNPSSATPVASPDSTTMYYVKVIDENGCVDYDSVKVTVIPSEFELGVPDGFTPNGDGKNDEFKVVDLKGQDGMAVENFDFKIFDRWGEKIFETDDVTVGWDGTHYKSKRKMEIGVYIWLLSYETVKGIKVGPVSGNVSLLR